MFCLYLLMLDDENDKHEFEKLYYKYREKMYQIALSILHNHADAQEAVSDAFYKIAKNYRKYIEKSVNIEILIVIIIRSISLDYYRKNKRRALREIHIQPIDDYDFTDEFDVSRIVGEILELPEKIRNAMYLRYVYGFSVKEIAELHNCGTTIIYQRISKGREILEEKLKGCVNHE